MEFQLQSLQSEFSVLLLQYLKEWSWPWIVLSLFLSFISLFWYLKSNKSFSGAVINIILPLLGSLPFLQNSNRLSEWFTEVFTSLNKGSFYIDGPIFSNLKFLATSDPKNIEYVLKTNFGNFPKLSYYPEVLDIFGEGIFNVESDPWSMQRRTAHSNLASKEFRALAGNVSREVVGDQLMPFLANVAKQQLTVDLQNVFSRLAFDINTGVLFGRNEGYLSIDLPANKLAEAGAIAEDLVIHRFTMPMFLWKLKRWLKVGTELQYAKARETIDLSFQKFISQKREDLHNGVESFDLLSLYIKSCEGETASDKFLKDSMMNFSVAGRDTIASSLTWFFWLVHQNRNVEMKILEELDSLVSVDENDETDRNQPQVFDSDDLKGLVYLHAALCESLRLFPPVPVLIRRAVKQDVLPDGSLVKPGMEIFLSFYSVARLSWIWGEDCLEFKPQRWINRETGKLSHEHMSKFFAFNFGPRTCVGKDITFTYLKSVVAAVLYNFHVEVVEDHHVCPKTTMIHHMENGLMVNVRERSNKLRSTT